MSRKIIGINIITSNECALKELDPETPNRETLKKVEDRVKDGNLGGFTL